MKRSSLLENFFPKFYHIQTDVISDIVKSYEKFVDEVLADASKKSDEEKVKMIQELVIAVTYFYKTQKDIFGISTRSIFDFNKLEDKITHYMFKNKLDKGNL